MAVRKFVCAVLCVLITVASAEAAPKKTKYDATATKNLLTAGANGEADDMLAALAAGADPNGRDEKGNTALIMASWNRLWKEGAVIDAMKKAKADLEAANDDGVTALMAAAGGGNAEMVALLLANGAKIDRKDKDGWTPLMYAAVNGEWSTAKPLVAAKADVKAVDTDGYSALAIALNRGRGAVAEILLDAGAALDDEMADGISPLVLATYGRDLRGVRLVLERKPKLLDVRDKDGWTPITIAAYNGDSQIVMDYLRAGADAKLTDKEGRNALDRAKENENAEVVALLTGKWTKPKADGTKIAVPCTPLGGTVEAYVAVEGEALFFTTIYPKPLNWYLGAANTNRAASSKKHTYDMTISPTFTFGEHTLDYMEYGTSMNLRYRDSKGEVREKQVYTNSLGADVKKGDETIDTAALSFEDTPQADIEDGTIRTRVPLSLVGLARGGKPVRVTAKVGNCPPVSAQIALK